MEKLCMQLVKTVGAFPRPARLALAIVLAALAMYQTTVFGESLGKALYHLTH